MQCAMIYSYVSDSDSCTSSPCFNNATCYDLIGSFVCKCVAGYFGDMCENKFQLPISAPETTTSCPTPEPEVDYCAGNPCNRRGKPVTIQPEVVSVCVLSTSLESIVVQVSRAN